MRTVDPAAGLAFAADGGAVAAGLFNAAWLVRYQPSGSRAGKRALRDGGGPGEQARRSVAALTLATVNAGIAVQAAFGQALFSANRWGLDMGPFFAPGPWLASRALVLAGTLLLSLLILRRPAR